MSQFKKFVYFLGGSACSVVLSHIYGFKVIDDMVRNGVVLAENYPKYIIPYTPISLAVIIAVLLLPVLMRYTKSMHWQQQL